MKARELFKLAVRILGLVFLYHGLIALPSLFVLVFGNPTNLLVMFPSVLWPLLVSYVLLRYARAFVAFFYPESED